VVPPAVIVSFVPLKAMALAPERVTATEAPVTAAEPETL
jgi:hypothetical protein